MNRILIAGLAIIVVVALSLFSYSFFSRQSGYSGKILGVEGVPSQNATSAAMEYGVRYFRLDLRDGNATEEALASNITAHGGHVLGILDYDTLGVVINDGVCTYNCNWSMDDWNQSVRTAMSDYPEVHYWEIWNEPQITNFQDGFQNGSPYNYYLMLRSAYQEIKARNDSDTVICMGGDNIYEGGPSFDPSGYEWASQLWSYGAGNYCDAVSLHAYTEFAYLANQTPYGGTSTMGTILQNGLSAYESLTGKPIWITEVGIPSNGSSLGNSDVKQAIFLNQTARLFLSRSYVEAYFWFKLEGNVGNLDFGLLNQSSLAPKPAMRAYSALANLT